ncbi:MAG: hypothetical protein ACRD8W_09265 [Nitrososphaeraceae archaeon]
MDYKSKHAKCLFCNEDIDALAAHLDAEHLQEGHTAYIIQELMIRIDQMENKIIQLQL